MKKKIILALAIVVALPISSISPVEAINFAENEQKYIELCASGALSSADEATCKEFNSYLKEKNENLKDEISQRTQEAADTQDSIDDLTAEIIRVQKQIDEKEIEIDYLETSIGNLENDIAKKEEELKDRMYTMQSYSNSRAIIDFIFSASDFTDLLSRVASLNEITEYDNQLIDELTQQKLDLEDQKSTLVIAKENLVEQQTAVQNKKATLLALYAQQNAALIAAKKAKLESEDIQEKVDDNLAALALATAQSQVSPQVNWLTNNTVGERIANLALSKRGLWYVWGGCHTMSEIMNFNSTRFDCSGLVNWAYYQAGVNIGVQYTGSLVRMGQNISRGNMLPGDIILFSSNGALSGIHHVGIYIGHNYMVHAPHTGSKIQIASLSSSYWQAEWYNVRRLY